MKRFLLYIVLRLTHRLWNRVFSRLLCQAYNDNVINSEQLHILHAKVDPTQEEGSKLPREGARV